MNSAGRINTVQRWLSENVDGIKKTIQRLEELE
jgi:hypothetical protein